MHASPKLPVLDLHCSSAVNTVTLLSCPYVSLPLPAGFGGKRHVVPDRVVSRRRAECWAIPSRALCTVIPAASLAFDIAFIGYTSLSTTHRLIYRVNRLLVDLRHGPHHPEPH